MNRYAWWKYAIMVIALLVGAVYTAPNFFGEAPAVQVSPAKSAQKVDPAVQARVEAALQAAGIAPELISLEAGSLRVRLADTDTQLKAKDAVQRALNREGEDPDYIVALNLLSRTQIMNTSYSSLHLVNSYGAFGSITRERYEIVLEGSADAVVTPATLWKEYQFKGKPGNPRQMAPQVAPYHLRLDWLMWFAAMPSPYYDPWFIRLVERLLQADAPTLSLLRENPFPDGPPRQIRALHYLYRFSTPEERRRSGQWWQRQLTGTYFPAVSLVDPAFRGLLQQLGND